MKSSLTTCTISSPMAHRSDAAPVNQLQTGAHKSANWDPIKVPHGFCSRAPLCVNAHWHVFVQTSYCEKDPRLTPEQQHNSALSVIRSGQPNQHRAVHALHLSLPPTTPHGTQLALGSNPAATTQPLDNIHTCTGQQPPPYRESCNR